jgi:UDP-N-acetylmuramoyl-L-alanyl-D-glutamate--2,6-diaminopimelate ligase
MNLKEILDGVDVLETLGSLDATIDWLGFDSREVVARGLYVAVPGTKLDGHQFINEAINRGAVAIVCEQLPESINESISYVCVNGSRAALGRIASNFYGRPSARMKLVGVTGTNGKTSTVTLLSRIFRALGFKVGLISTIRNEINDVVIPATHTTPDALQLNRLMRGMVDTGCSYCFMEVTSHAIAQNRIEGLTFAGGVFTNLTHDHLDYHKTIDAYFAVKRRFFTDLPGWAFALSNIDDERGYDMLEGISAHKATYSLDSRADFVCRVIDNVGSGLVLEIDGLPVRSKLHGRFNAYNLLAAYGSAVLLLGDKLRVAKTLPALEPVEGRFDVVESNHDVTAIVDFAHTPDGLEKILSGVNEMRKLRGRLITVVGCGGDKDKEKRPKMGRIAYDNSDIVIFTSDNPRTEDPLAIIDAMHQDLPMETANKVIVIVDRKEAIRTSCAMARSGDTILLAGRGHEQFQTIGLEKTPFSDRQVLEESLGVVARGG